MYHDVELAQKGDKKAFQNLIYANELSMYRVAKAMLKSDEDCADAIQETLIKSYKSISSLKQINYFKTWLIKILINECNKILKTRKKVIFIDNITYEKDALDEYEKLELKQIIEGLEYELKTIVILYYFEDLSVREVAETIGIPEGTVKSRLSRARTKLSKELSINEGGICCE